MAESELTQIRAELFHLKDEKIAANYKRYLKSPYEFYGLRVPQLRKITKKYKNLSIYDAYNLFDELFVGSDNHEEMNLAIFLLQNYKKHYNPEMWKFLTRERVLSKLRTWDMVDALCTGILGYILAENTHLNSEIKQFSQSKNPWIRRVSIVSQLPSIKKGKIQLTILLAESLCYDNDVYVQKATGWMLREAAKKNPVQIKEFIKIHKDMKPACLSYATEKMPEFRTLIKRMKEEDKLSKDNNDNINKQEGKSELDKIKYFKN